MYERISCKIKTEYWRICLLFPLRDSILFYSIQLVRDISVNVFTCSSKEMTLGWIFSKVKWYTAFAVASERFGRCVQKSVRSCLEMTRLTFSLTTVKKKQQQKKYSMTSCSKPSWTCWKHKLRGTAHTCFHKGLQGFQLIHICKLNSLVQNLSISMKCYTKIHFYKVVYMLKRPNLINTI